jgi:phosphocarrier protein HPr
MSICISSITDRTRKVDYPMPKRHRLNASNIQAQVDPSPSHPVDPFNWTRQLVIRNELGLHARPAAKIALLAQKAKFGIWLIKGDKKVDATSVIDILSLDCPQNTEISLSVDHAEDLPILEKMIHLFDANFGE